MINNKNMKIVKTFITSILFFICFAFNAQTEEFFFEGEEIQILDTALLYIK